MLLQSRSPAALRSFSERSGVDLGAAVDAVLHTLWNHIDPGEVAKIKTLLPPELAALWPDRPDAVDIELAQTRHHRGGDPR